MEVEEFALGCFSSQLVDQPRKDVRFEICAVLLLGELMPFELVIDKVAEMLLELICFVAISTVIAVESAIAAEKYPAAQLIPNHLGQS